MSSDEAYSSFLDKANQDPSSGTAASSSSNKNKQGDPSLSTKAVDTDIPASLQSVVDSDKYFYISDSDEPFQPVSLKYGDDEADLDADTLAKIINHHKDKISAISAKDFDPRGQYKEVVQAVEGASGSKDTKVKFFRVEGSGSRAEYWVLAVESSGKRLVGLKALAVES